MSQKWRTLCARGIYPFTDGNVEDFDPIFSELAKVSGDQTNIFYKPDEYARPFFPVAEKLVASAAQAEGAGDTAQARDHYLRAAAVYRLARFPINRSPVSQQAWERGKAAYVKAGPLLNPPSVCVDIPFTHASEPAGDRNVAIQAYLRLPNGQRPEKGWPVLLFICGLDAYRTDHTPRTRPTWIVVSPR